MTQRILALSLGLLAACARPATAPVTSPAARGELTPPVAERRAHELSSPHGTRSDPYYWLRDDSRSDPDVLAYLRAENAYTDALLAPTAALQVELVAEMVARLPEVERSVPLRRGDAWYYERTHRDDDYPVHVRRTGSLDAPEQVVLDVNALAESHAFYKIGDLQFSPDGRLVAYTEDTVGRNQFALRIRDIATGELLPETASDLGGELAWSGDGASLLYTAREPGTLRAYRVNRHVMGTASARDTVVYDEADPAFELSLSTTKSGDYLVVYADSTAATESLLIDSDHTERPPRVFIPRERDHDYQLDHDGTRFVVRTNAGAPNFRLVAIAPGDEARRDAWVPLTAARDDAFVEDFAVYPGAVAAVERTGGLARVRVLPERGPPYYVEADEPAYTMGLMAMPSLDDPRLLYTFESPTTPEITYSVEPATRERTLLKSMAVPGYDPSAYVTQLRQAPARDGVRVPVSIVYRRDRARGGGPLLLRGYGAYGLSSDPGFQRESIGLLDRGFALATAHIRGGQELGRAWYEAGRMQHKHNTFTDFIDATRYLVDQGYASRDQVFALGGSAGGLLMGAVVNMAPSLYRGVIAAVPFVDVVTTMMDDTIPLTTFEYEEWGNPAITEQYAYMLSYSPYDNVAAQDYPAMLVTTGLWDSQVQYYEPVKWVAKLRATKTDDLPLLLHVDMQAGHGGGSGRTNRFREIARYEAFMLSLLRP